MEKIVKNDEGDTGSDLIMRDVGIKDIAGILMSKIVYLIIIAVVGFALTFACMKIFVTPEYKSSVMLSVYANPNSLSQDVKGGISYSELSAAQALANSYKVAIKRNTVAEIIKQDVNSTFGYELTAESIIKMTEVSVINDTFFIQIDVVSTDKMVAYNVANSYSKNVKSIYEILHLGAINASIDAQIAAAPFSPRTLRNSVFGALLAAVAAGVFFVIRTLSDTTIYSEKETGKITALPVIGYVPEIVAPADQKPERWTVEDGGRISLDEQ